MGEKLHLPNPDRLSVLAGSILLAYALGRFIDLPLRDINISILGILLKFQINFRTLVTFLVAGMTAAGAEWLFRSHPNVHGHRTVEHWLLPGLTAWVISLPLYQLPIGYQWWIGFAVGGTLLGLVLFAEYITIDPKDVRNPAAIAGLTAVSFTLFLIMVISFHSQVNRLYLILPAITLAGGLIGLRTLHLRLRGIWTFSHAMLVALVAAQLAAGLYYLPITSVIFGLLITGSIYSLTSLLANLEDGGRIPQALIEPGIVLLLIIGASLWLK